MAKKLEPVIIGLFSLCGGVGKTTLSCALARNLARDGYKVLIIDLNFEYPGVHRWLDDEGLPLIKYLFADPITLKSASEVEVCKPHKDIENLWFTSGSEVNTKDIMFLQGYLLAEHRAGIVSSRLWNMIEVLRKKHNLNFDFVILDNQTGICGAPQAGLRLITIYHLSITAFVAKDETDEKAYTNIYPDDKPLILKTRGFNLELLYAQAIRMRQENA